MNGILKNKIALALLAFTLLTTTLFSCKKYAEDSGIHLYRTANSRVTNTWGVAQVLVNSADATGSYNDFNPELAFTIQRNGDYTVYCDGFVLDKTGTKNPYITDVRGTWQFLDKKKNLGLTQGLFSSNIDKYEIIKLTKNEMWLRQKNGTTTTEIHYIAK